jgi:hypothetical protein
MMKRPGVGQIVLLAALIGLLILTAVWAVWAWNAGAGADIGKHGWIALGLGAFFSLVIGCGLMALMFFSSRSGYDEAADPFRQNQFAEPFRFDGEEPPGGESPPHSTGMPDERQAPRGIEKDSPNGSRRRHSR